MNNEEFPLSSTSLNQSWVVCDAVSTNYFTLAYTKKWRTPRALGTKLQHEHIEQ